MTNEMVIWVFSLLAVVAGITILVSFMQKGMRNVTITFVLFGVCMLGWQLSNIAYFAVNNYPSAMFLYNLEIPFVAVGSALFLLLVLRFYRQDRFITKPFFIGLFVVPALTTVVALTSPFHSLLRISQTLVEIEPLHIMQQVRGPWFWVHAAYCYVLIGAAVVVALVQHRRLPQGYRAPSVIITIAVLLAAASNLFSIFASPPIDITLIGMTISFVFIYIAITTSAKSDLLTVARDEIFNYMEELVFILSLDRQVLDANLAARQWISSLNLTPEFPIPFSHIMETLHEKGVSIRENTDSEDGIDIYFSHNEYDVMYNLKERFVLDETERPIGFYITLFDVTRYKTIIDRLEVMSEIDPLTGLANRRAYESLKARYRDATPPLSIIIGDVNNLKHVNDEMGHQQGDQLLQVVARQLRRSCPEHGTVVRIGGDEFVMLLPNTTREEAQRIMFSINQGLRNKTTYPFIPSIALGLATKTLPNEDLDEMIRHADIDMYHNKNDRRRR